MFQLQINKMYKQVDNFKLHKQEPNNIPMTPEMILQLKLKYQKTVKTPDFSKEAWDKKVQENPKLTQQTPTVRKILETSSGKEEERGPKSRRPRGGRQANLRNIKKLQKELWALADSEADRETIAKNIKQINNMRHNCKLRTCQDV